MTDYDYCPPPWRGLPVVQSYVTPMAVRRQNPWHRLHLNRTINSHYKTVFHDNSEAPKDKLDLNLKSTYDHFLDSCKPPIETVKQKMEHRCYKRLFEKDPPFRVSQVRPVPGHLLYVSTHPERIYVSNAKLSIAPSHIAATNAGYSRKAQDGTFYRD